MSNRLDLTGKVYDELTVTEMLYNYQNKHKTYCRCITTNGNEVIVRADNLQSGATHCGKGAGRSGHPLDISGMKFGFLTVIRPTEKRASNGSIIWECKCECGNFTYVPAGQLTRKHTLSCGCKHKSKWEMFISEFLSSCNINYQEQKRFNDCRNRKGTDTLPFDFYLIDYCILIEYDGIHHYEPINGWGGYEKFKVVQENDAIKNNYCITNGIPLLRLPYTLTENEIKNKILNILSPVTITV